MTKYRYKIAEARMAKGWTQSDLAKKIGTTQQQIARYESDDNDVKGGALVKISQALGVTISYLLGMDSASIPSGSMVEVPLYGAIAAGTPIEMVEVEDTQPIPVQLHERYPDSFLLKVEDDSMDRILPNGCFALVDPCDDVTHDGDPYAVCV